MAANMLPCTKLDPARVDELYRRAVAGEVQRELAKEFGISWETLYSYLVNAGRREQSNVGGESAEIAPGKTPRTPDT